MLDIESIQSDLTDKVLIEFRYDKVSNYNDNPYRSRVNSNNRSIEAIATKELVDNQLVIQANARRNIRRQAVNKDAQFYIHLNDDSLGIKKKEVEEIQEYQNNGLPLVLSKKQNH